MNQVARPNLSSASLIRNPRKATNSLPCHTPPTSLTKRKQKRNRMRYTLGTQPLITSFTKSPPIHVTNAIWGHSLDEIDKSSCFRLFLQNPNGLSITTARECLLQDLLTCHSYGTAVISLPETNTKWDLPSIKSQFHAMLRRVWPLQSLCHSKSPEIFNSSYQPGGTATILCDNWISRIISKGEDPLGLGRWSYITLCGKGSCLITLVTAYCPSTAPGETTNYRQQYRTLANIFHRQNLQMSTNPTRQFFLDLQSWIEHLIDQDHQIILCLDANSTYDPDQHHEACPLTYVPGSHTLSTRHDGKLSTLIATCNLTDPLARQHSTRPFPASHIRGTERIDFILTSPSLFSSVLRSRCLPQYSVFNSDHRTYYVDFDASLLFSDPTYEISRPIARPLRVQDPRLVEKYCTILDSKLSYYKVYESLHKILANIHSGQPPPPLQTDYNTLDTIITECMLHAERKAARKKSTKYAWSPELSSMVYRLRFWSITLCSLKGGKVFPQRLQHYATKAGLTKPPTQDITTAITNL